MCDVVAEAFSDTVCHFFAQFPKAKIRPKKPNYAGTEFETEIISITKKPELAQT